MVEFESDKRQQTLANWTNHDEMSQTKLLKDGTPQSNMQTPSTAYYCTPPRSLYKIKNPFERTLVDSLSSHMCSPGMFKIRESSGTFTWDIEQVSILKPADIVACNSQFQPSPDPVLEKKATAAIEKFFSQKMIVPSPFDEATKRTGLLSKEVKDLVSTPDSNNKCNVWTQTGLTFPAILPPELEDVLRPFYTFKKDQSMYDADMSANASLRRKLCFEEEEENSDGENNKSLGDAYTCVTRGVKRTLNSSGSSISYQLDSNVGSTSNSSGHKSVSPILVVDSRNCRPGEISQHLKSPSLSPIRMNAADKMCCSKASLELSHKSDSHHDFDTSLFSQSTPEKSPPSNSYVDSSPDAFDTSETKLFKSKFHDEDFHQIGKNYLKFNQRSRSETSLSDFKRSICSTKSDNNMDISSDVSMLFSRDQSLRGHTPLGNSTESLPSSHAQTSNNLDMEFVETDLPKFNDAQSLPNHLNLLCNTDLVVAAKQKLFDDETFPTNHDNCDKFAEVYQYMTPTKNLRSRDLTLNGSPHIKNWSSPMQMSFDTSYNVETDKFPMKQFNDTETTFRRMDSGFADLSKPLQRNKFTSSIDITVCRTAKFNSTGDVTKSLQSTVDSSSWKRFDSGFHDETSSDYVHQATGNDDVKAFPQKYSPIAEYLEDHKELVNFDDFNKFLECGTRAQSSMSVSEVFGDDMLSLIKFSSTPSKQQSAK